MTITLPSYFSARQGISDTRREVHESWLCPPSSVCLQRQDHSVRFLSEQLQQLVQRSHGICRDDASQEALRECCHARERFRTRCRLRSREVCVNEGQPHVKISNFKSRFAGLGGFEDAHFSSAHHLTNRSCQKASIPAVILTVCLTASLHQHHHFGRLTICSDGIDQCIPRPTTRASSSVDSTVQVPSGTCLEWQRMTLGIGFSRT